MRLRWLLPWLLILVPTAASAHRIRVEDQYSIGAAIKPGIHAGTLVLAFYNPSDHIPVELPIRVRHDNVDYDWLTVELSNEFTHRTLTFVSDREKAVAETITIEPRGIFIESIDLDSMTTDLPPGEYKVAVTWANKTTTPTTTFVPYRCGLTWDHMKEPPSPTSKLPYVLGAFALLSLLVASWLGKRAGTDDARMPHSVV